jgi:hypothetical protein
LLVWRRSPFAALKVRVTSEQSLSAGVTRRCH